MTTDTGSTLQITGRRSPFTGACTFERRWADTRRAARYAYGRTGRGTGEEHQHARTRPATAWAEYLRAEDRPDVRLRDPALPQVRHGHPVY